MQIVLVIVFLFAIFSLLKWFFTTKAGFITFIILTVLTIYANLYPNEATIAQWRSEGRYVDTTPHLSIPSNVVHPNTIGECIVIDGLQECHYHN